MTRWIVVCGKAIRKNWSSIYTGEQIDGIEAEHIGINIDSSRIYYDKRDAKLAVEQWKKYYLGKWHFCCKRVES